MIPREAIPNRVFLQGRPLSPSLQRGIVLNVEFIERNVVFSKSLIHNRISHRNTVRTLGINRKNSNNLIFNSYRKVWKFSSPFLCQKVSKIYLLMTQINVGVFLMKYLDVYYSWHTHTEKVVLNDITKVNIVEKPDSFPSRTILQRY